MERLLDLEIFWKNSGLLGVPNKNKDANAMLGLAHTNGHEN